VTLVPASHRRRTARRSSSTSPPHTPCAPMSNACRSESPRQSGRTGQRTQTAMACVAWSRALATFRVMGTNRRDRAELRGGCVRMIAASAAVRWIIELTGAQAALAMERSTTARSVQFF
jgi:hypothetical protein